MNRQSRSIALGRIMGIPISLDWSWFLIVGIFTWTMATGFYPERYPAWPELQLWVIGALTSLLLFASVLLHELGHAVVALAFGIPVRRIRLLIFGGVAELGEESPSAVSEFSVAIAGPVVSVVLAVLLGAGWFMLRFTGLLEVPVLEVVAAVAGYLGRINIMLALFNLIPGFPLDGGRVLRAVVWAISGSLSTATRIAGGVGRLVGFGFMGIGLWQILSGSATNGLWIGLIGMFLQGAAGRQIQAQQLRDSLEGQTVSEVMTHNYATLPADIPLQRLMEARVLGAGGRTYVVTRSDEAVGMLTMEDVETLPRLDWATLTIGDAMTELDDRDIQPLQPDTGLWTALQRMEMAGLQVLPVIAGGALMGVVRRDDLLRFLHRIQMLGSRVIRL